jgi:hypothetical protein
MSLWRLQAASVVIWLRHLPAYVLGRKLGHAQASAVYEEGAVLVDPAGSIALLPVQTRGVGAV